MSQNYKARGSAVRPLNMLDPADRKIIASFKNGESGISVRRYFVNGSSTSASIQSVGMHRLVEKFGSPRGRKS